MVNGERPSKVLLHISGNATRQDFGRLICKARLDSIAPFDSASRFMMASSGLRNILEGMTVMKPLLFVVFVLFTFSGLNAQTPTWQPSPGHTQMEIWPGTPPDAAAAVPPGPETATIDTKDLVAGRPIIGVVTCRGRR